MLHRSRPIRFWIPSRRWPLIAPYIISERVVKVLDLFLSDAKIHDSNTHYMTCTKKKKTCTRELKLTRKTSLKTVTTGERLTPGPLKQKAGDGGQVLRKIKWWLGQCNQAFLILFYI